MLRGILIWIGGLALLAATAIDTIAVIGRHVGLPLRGSIELMQAMILVAGATGITLATVAGKHARVRLLIERFRNRTGSLVDRVSDFVSALFFVALLIGSGWIAIDLWHGHEMSELFGVPWRLLRLIANVCLLVCILVTLRRVFGRSAQ